MKKITIKVSVSTTKNLSTSETEFELNEADWLSMSEREREDVCREQMFQLNDWNYQICD